MATKVRHWKHGWIPISPEARAYVAGKGPRPVTERDAGNLMSEIQKRGGFTYNPKSGHVMQVGKDKGFAVAVPGTERIVGQEKVNGEDVTREDFAKGVASVLMEHRKEIAAGAVLGGWYSPERNQYMVELTHIVPPNKRDEAIKLGQDRNQEAIFDISNGETIFTGGTGDAGDIAAGMPPVATKAISAPVAPLRTEEKAAAKYYTGPGFVPLNGALRSGSELPPSVAFYKEQLDSALAKHRVQRDTTVYRGLSSGPWLLGNPPGFNPGDTYSDAGYMSTAASDGPPDNYKADVMFQIEVPKGTNALDLNGNGLTHHQEESELLLPAGTNLRVLSDTIQDGQRVVHLSVA